MAALELFHRIYTHAPDAWSAAGGRFQKLDRDVESVLRDAARRELDELLTKLEPAGHSPAWAMRRFAGGGESFACLVVAYRGFADVEGRNGTLKHARVVRLDPAEPWLNPLPLIEEARAFPIGEAKSLRAYLDLLPDDATLAVPPLGVAAIERVPKQLLRDVLIAALATHGKRGARRVFHGHPRIADLALAAASLPAGLQRASSWAFDAADGVPVDAIWSADGELASTLGSRAVQHCVDAYLRLLLESSYDLGPLMSDDGIREPKHLQTFVEKAAIVSQAGKATMSSKNKSRPEPARRGDDLPAGFDRQYEALYRSLRDYLDKRLAAHKEVRDDAAAPRRPEWPTAIITAVTTAALILGGQWALQKFRQPPVADPFVQQQQTETADETSVTQTVAPPSPRRVAVQKLIAEADSNGKWPEAVQTLSEQHADVLAQMVDRAANAQDVTEGVRSRLIDLSERLRGRGKPIDADARAALRPLLFEYVVKMQADEQTVDGKLNEIDAALLRRTKERWRVRSNASDVDDRALHSEVILRWLEGNLQ